MSFLISLMTMFWNEARLTVRPLRRAEATSCSKIYLSADDMPMTRWRNAWLHAAVSKDDGLLGSFGNVANLLERIIPEIYLNGLSVS